ncbi:leukocyte elastase inhibitor [Cherax quadricarinatus]|uniref:leukocyte elastase inhibitor n=1 Tax=Cherax quadricarinatus TaxID=27406 RepID=UPI00387E5662
MMRWVAVASVALVTIAVATTGKTSVSNCFTEKRRISGGFQTDLSGINGFGFDLYRQFSFKNTVENVFFSPYSIWASLALSYFGSAGNTKTQLEAKLGLTDKTSTLKLWRALEMVYAQRAIKNPHYTFSMASRVYFNNNLHLRPCITSIFYKELQSVDFSNVVGTAAAINDFVSSTTKGLIPQVVTPDDMVDALMMLVNAAYFKGIWMHRFQPSSTTNQKFFISPAHSVDVPMMNLRTYLRQTKSPQLGAQILELPYIGGDISMLLLLPDEEGEIGFSRMVSALNGGTFFNLISKWSGQTVLVDVLLPKFRLEQTLKDELKESLKNLGINDLFNISSANLTDFVVHEVLSVSKTIHKAFVEVSEEGTEAAAATGQIGYTRFGFGKPRNNFLKFHCNRPFLFLIFDNQMKNVLFMGAYKHPAGDTRKGGSVFENQTLAQIQKGK